MTTRTVCADVPTASASRYLQQLAKHWSHKLKVDYSPDAGTIDFPNGARLALHAAPDTLHVTVTVPEDGDLERMCEVVAFHIERFAFREAPLPFDWQDG